MSTSLFFLILGEHVLASMKKKRVIFASMKQKWDLHQKWT
jgi:hypothetical protein